MTPLPSPPLRTQAPAIFSANADALMTALPGFVTEANALQTDVTTKQSTASTAATAATTQAGNASTSAANSSTYATNSANSATYAGTAAANVMTMDKRYLGAFSSAPTVDNQGAALQTGAVYYDSQLGTIRTWNGSAWIQGISSVAGVSTFNGQSGAVIGTTSVNGMTGVVVLPASPIDIFNLAMGII